MVKREYRSDIMAAIHETAEGLHRADVIDRKTMREYDALCLQPAPDFAPEQIRRIREREKVSQGVFAAYLSVSKNLVSDWERGVKKPGGPAKRLLEVVSRAGLAALVF